MRHTRLEKIPGGEIQWGYAWASGEPDGPEKPYFFWGFREDTLDDRFPSLRTTYHRALAYHLGNPDPEPILKNWRLSVSRFTGHEGMTDRLLQSYPAPGESTGTERKE
jgi:hypothetical protein